MPTDLDQYSTIVFIDTMVVLESPPLAQLPWHEIDSAGPILVLVLPQVQAEIDKRKRDGRLAERARAFSRLISPSVVSQQPVRITDKHIAVDLMLAACGPVDFDRLDLDRDEGDHRVVGQMLNVKGVDLARCVLISHDINPIAVGNRLELRTLLLPDHWLLPPEMSPKDKENQRLKAEVKELKKTQPEILLSIAVELPDDFAPLVVLPLDQNEEYDLKAAVFSKLDAAANGVQKERYSATVTGVFSADGGRRKWREETVPKWAGQLATNLQELSNQFRFTLTIENIGPVNANGVVAEVSVNGGRFDSMFHASHIAVPRPPKPHDGLAISLPQHQPFPTPPGDHELHWGTKPHRGHYGELHCKDFRQGRRAEVSGFVEVQPSNGSDFTISVRLTASNLHGDVQTTWSKRLIPRETHFSSIFDVEKLKFQGSYPLEGRMQKAADTLDTSWIKFPKRD